MSASNSPPAGPAGGNLGTYPNPPAAAPPWTWRTALLDPHFLQATEWQAMLIFAIVIAWLTKSDALVPMLTLVATKAATIVDFYFGSAIGSRNKDVTIAAIASTAVQQQSPAAAVPAQLQPQGNQP